jgi:hypothetical protein
VLPGKHLKAQPALPACPACLPACLPARLPACPAGQLGDGRAICLGQSVNAEGERWELQLKVGPGTAPALLVLTRLVLMLMPL